MTVEELLVRARGAIGRKIKYRMGGGLLVPAGPSPADETGACDCSAFVCWCLGIQKYRPDLAWLVRINGGWYNTDGIWWDARWEATGMFEWTAYAEVGQVIVYPSRAVEGEAKVGHVGIVSVVTDRHEPRKVIHCSSGAYHANGDAVAETGPDVFLRVPAWTTAWCAATDRR